VPSKRSSKNKFKLKHFKKQTAKPIETLKSFEMVEGLETE